MNGSCVSSRRLSCAYLAVFWTNLWFLLSTNKADGCADGGVGVGRESFVEFHVPDFSENHALVSAANEIAGEREKITGLPEVRQPDSSKFVDTEGGDGDLVGFPVSDAGDAAETAAHATAGESEEILGLHVSPSSLHNSSNSRGCVAAVACARLPAVPGVSARVCPVSSSSAVSAAVAHARFTPMHDAHNSGGTGGLLPVHRSTSCCLGNSWSDTGRVTGPTGRRCTKGGVSGPAEDLRPVSEVEAGVNFRLAGEEYGDRLQVHFLGGKLGTGTRSKQGKCGHTFPPPGGS